MTEQDSPKPPHTTPARVNLRYRDRDRELYTAGELVQRGGLAGGLSVLLYIVVGLVFWSLVGWGLDRLLGTQWLVLLGAGIGSAAGIYLGYVHMRHALNPRASQVENQPETKQSPGQGPSPRV